jgi:tetratricopeptide (TPR) repeat protein
MLHRIHILFLLPLLLTGCSMAGLTSSFRADYYFRSQEYDKGISYFQENIRQRPNSGVDHYYLGRFSLASQKPEDAVSSLTRAVELDPGNAEYHFWLGMALGETGNEEGEMRQYQYALQENPSHAKARLYMANLLLKQGRYQQALAIYDKLLERYPYNASALYNKALCYRLINDENAEKKAWQEYLKYYPAGYLAARAADHLNVLGDFSYRNYPFGYRTLTLRNISFWPENQALTYDARTSMRLVGRVLSNFDKGNLAITVFFAGNEKVAKERALHLKNFLLQEFPDLDSDRIVLSWFGSPERLYFKGKEYAKNESVRLYLVDWKQR